MAGHDVEDDAGATRRGGTAIAAGEQVRKLIVVALLALQAVACSNLPDANRVAALVREQALADGLGDLFRLENFRKTNGFQPSKNVYVVDVEYDLVFLKGFGDVVREIGENPTGPQYGVFGSKLILAAIQSNFGHFKAGDRITKREKITLHHTENGWQIAAE